MSDIKVGTLVKIKPGVFYKGHDLSRRWGVVTKVDNYLMVEFSEIEEPVKIISYEIEDYETEDVDLDLFFSEKLTL